MAIKFTTICGIFAIPQKMKLDYQNLALFFQGRK
jgi:hypothetical protein